MKNSHEVVGKSFLLESETKKLTILSYQLSQGLPSLQANILAYISRRLMEENIAIDSGVFLEVCKKIREHMFKRMVKNGLHRDGASLDSEAFEVENTYLPRINECENANSLVPDIAIAMFIRDKKFLREGRSNPEERGRRFLEHYGRDGNKTGHNITDELMQQVWSYKINGKNSYIFYELERNLNS